MRAEIKKYKNHCGIDLAWLVIPSVLQIIFNEVLHISLNWWQGLAIFVGISWLLDAKSQVLDLWWD